MAAQFYAVARSGRGRAALYPAGYAVSAFPDQVRGTGIVDSHSLIRDALFHAFATLGVLIATAVSAASRYPY